MSVYNADEPLCCVYLGRKQASLWAAGREYRQGTSDAVEKPKLGGCLVTVVNNLSLDDNQNCDTSTIAVDDNMVCVLDVVTLVSLTHTNHFNGHFPVKMRLANCPLNSQSPFILILNLCGAGQDSSHIAFLKGH